MLHQEKSLIELRRTAEEFARDRHERLTTCHLLAAIAHRPSPASDLLGERRLTVEVLLKASRVVVDEPPDSVTRSIQKAREIAARSGTRSGDAIHLLIALAGDRPSAACRAMAQCGIDITRLRGQALAVASGAVLPRRVAVTKEAAAHAKAMMPSPRIAPAEPKTPAEHKLPELKSHAEVKRPEPRSAVVAKPSTHSKVVEKAHPHHDRKKKTKSDGKSAFALDAKKFPALSKHGKNLSVLASEGELDDVVERDELLDLALDVLGRRDARNPCFVGVSGVGKTALLRGLAAHSAASGSHVFIEIDPISLLVAHAGKAGGDPLSQVVEEAKRAQGHVILVVDDLGSVFASEGPDGLLQLRLAISKSEVVCVGTSSVDDYRKVIEGDPGLRRAFSALEVEEPTTDEVKPIVVQAARLYAEHHELAFQDIAIDATIEWSTKYLTGSAQPQKALSILDLAGARARRQKSAEVTKEDIAKVVTEVTGVPEERLMEEDGEKLLRLAELLEERVVGHGRALARIASILRRSAMRIRKDRPLGSFLLLGPTGVGKTETAKAIAECLFSAEDAMTRLDLSEFAEAHSIARLIGAPPGYVGHEAGGQLTEAIKRRPYQVILLDEIEKAHRDVLEAFLQVFDEGRMTDGRGRTVDFTNTVIVLTSNLGAEALMKESRPRMGFGQLSSSRSVAADPEQVLLQAAREGLPPELFNRFDEVIAYGPLARAEVSEIARRLLARLAGDLLLAKGLRLDVGEEAIEALLDNGGFDLALGARPMRRAIEKLVEAPLSELILRGEAQAGDVVFLTVEDGKIVVDAISPAGQRATA